MMIKKVVSFIVLVIMFSSCKKYYNCNCVRVVETPITINAAVPTYSTTTTTYTVPIAATTSTKNSQCGALGGTSGLTTITCGIN